MVPLSWHFSLKNNLLLLLLFLLMLLLLMLMMLLFLYLMLLFFYRMLIEMLMLRNISTEFNVYKGAKICAV